MRLFFLICSVCLLLCSTLEAQRFRRFEYRPFNWGGTVGFNATFPIINTLSVDEVKAENIRLQYKVGYIASVFCRVNIERFFIQPSFSINQTEGEIHFTIPQTANTDAANYESNFLPTDMLTLKTRSLEVPILIGYYIVKEGPYGLSLMAGPTFKYNYDVSYTSEISSGFHEFESDNTPYGVGLMTSVSVSIWRLFLDFSYEFGINHIESDFKDKYNQDPITAGKLSIDKRTNRMGFALGFVF